MKRHLLFAALSGIFFCRLSHAQDITMLGGDMTSEFTDRNAIQLNAPNVTDETRRQTQLAGFGIFHHRFEKSSGLGPSFINPQCGGCHINNGRGPTKFNKSDLVGSSMVVKVSLAGLKPDGSPREVPGVGEQLLDHEVSKSSKIKIDLAWEFVRRSYPDGTPYQLRKPKLTFSIKGNKAKRIRTSLRMTPAVIGPGLLEAIPESTILEYSDPHDLDGDGISGRPNYVIDVKTKQYKIGRFGFKASHPTAEQQIAAALFHDIGVTNSLFPGPSIAIPELSDDELNKLVLYQKLAGVPKAQSQGDSQVSLGKFYFQIVGCSKCHRMTMTTASYPDPELSNQEFHPFTDLLLHDMGKDLADKRAEFSARGSEWRTTPLWGLGFSRRLTNKKINYLHDGRARTIEEAILWHGGEAAQTREIFEYLTKDERAALLAFLNSL